MNSNTSRRVGRTVRIYPWWETFNTKGSIDGCVCAHDVGHCAEATWGDNNSSGGKQFDKNGVVDTNYWQIVLDQLKVHLAKMEL